MHFTRAANARFEILLQLRHDAGSMLDGTRAVWSLDAGVGRLTVWLAQQFENIIAADISGPHLELAGEAAARFDRSNVSFVRLSSLRSLKEVEPFDVILSLITLQHNPPPIIATMLSEILNKLNDGGIIPTYKRGYSFKIKDYINNFDNFDKLEMHVFPQDGLFRSVEQCNCVLLEVREDGYTGIDSGVSNTILVRRRSRRPAQGRAVYARS
jgi:SAM-dependent methyltransferase